jgi:hypothetical protein
VFVKVYNGWFFGQFDKFGVYLSSLHVKTHLLMLFSVIFELEKAIFNYSKFLKIDLLKQSETAPTKCATFRLSKEKLEKLRKAADDRNISPNTLVNQILKAYLDWHSMARSAKLYYFPKSFLIRLINELTNDELSVLARDVAKNDLVDISLFLRGGFNIDSVSEITETWLRIAQMPHRIEVAVDNQKIIIDHGMGHKYSYLIKEISRYLLEVAFETKSSCEITDNAVIITVWQK